MHLLLPCANATGTALKSFDVTGARLEIVKSYAAGNQNEVAGIKDGRRQPVDCKAARSLEDRAVKGLRDVFETNTFGTIAMTQAVLPQFRQRTAGAISHNGKARARAIRSPMSSGNALKRSPEIRCW